ncbi:TPA: hypothetical protein N0F65_003132 [Lagenidium giganteum]|uniref:Nucleotide-diphospho-sugar transferase n=1 Tax=Lagenidium giganteum TaxID=4803 RepID=A0AAV2YV06_9STRA|nr:TPA: hypothetical protein N0F65_003132 [Lagenidium giganteum]
MLLQRLIVTLCTWALHVQSKLLRRKWLVLFAICVYVGVRSHLPSPLQPKKLRINKVITVFSPEMASMRPAQIAAPWTNETFECIGWKRLHVCPEPDQFDEAGNKKKKDPKATPPPTKAPVKMFFPCNETINSRMAGYCVIRNRTSNEVHHVMVTACDSLPTGSFTCEMARDFTEYGMRSVGYQHFPTAPSLALPLSAERREPTNGIVMVIYDRVLPSAYATIKLLRFVGCELPVELWYRPDEMSMDNPIIHRLLMSFNVRMRTIFDDRAQGFHVKPYAVYYSNFDNVLLLDADNLPAKDPTYLFEEPEFLKTGAIFWPDYWQPSNSLFQLTNVSMLWELTGVQYTDMFEQESGQVLINRIKSRPALEKLMYYSTHTPRLMEELHQIWGDKDLFRLAWLNASQPFHYIQYPPAVGGYDMRDEKGVFCGLAMIQHDVQGNLVFFHRNAVKLDGSLNQPRIMTHIQEYSLKGDPRRYKVYQVINAIKDCCYHIGTEQLPDGQPATHVTKVSETNYAFLEERAIQFSIEGKRLLDQQAAIKPVRAGFGPTAPAEPQEIGLFATSRLVDMREVIGILLSAYVLLVICMVSCKARPGPALIVVLTGAVVVILYLCSRIEYDVYNTKHPIETLGVTPSQVTALWTNESFECVGWQPLRECSSDDPGDEDTYEQRHHDAPAMRVQSIASTQDMPLRQPCDHVVKSYMAGYCVVRNRTSGEELQLMVTACKTLRRGEFRCNMARAFTDYAVTSVGYEHDKAVWAMAANASSSQRSGPTRGVVMAIYDDVMPATYATIRLLRHLGCTLPIELWYRPQEMKPRKNLIVQRLVADYNAVLRAITDPRATRFYVKPYAVYYSAFDQVLLLDADVLPTKDPTYLFDDPAFVTTSAIFWPDFWQPDNCLFKITNVSLIWQLTGVEFVDMFEQDSGQVLVDRTKSKAALDKLMYYSMHKPRLLNDLALVWGDKDLFRLAWMNTSTPFHFVSYPPAMGGLDLRDIDGHFCGLAMVQHDPRGDHVFIHRNSVKLDGLRSQQPVVTHIQEFALAADPKRYRVNAAWRPYQRACYFVGTKALPDGQPPVRVFGVNETAYAELEMLAIQFSIEGRDLDVKPDDSWLIMERMVMAMTAVGVVFLGLVWWCSISRRLQRPQRTLRLQVQQEKVV